MYTNTNMAKKQNYFFLIYRTTCGQSLSYEIVKGYNITTVDTIAGKRKEIKDRVLKYINIYMI